MTAREFVEKYYAYALESQLQTGVNALVVLAQCALETGWGSVVIGNMMFGKKDIDGINGNEQLISTTEYIDKPDKKFPVVMTVTQVGKKLWKYRVKDWFRKYDSPKDSFVDHSLLISKKKIYAEAMKVADDPYLFAAAIHKAGYATDPKYTIKLHALITMIKKLI